VAAGPVSRIRWVTVQSRRLLNRNPRGLSMTSTLSTSAGFASHRRPPPCVSQREHGSPSFPKLSRCNSLVRLQEPILLNSLGEAFASLDCLSVGRRGWNGAGR
jgi:hypothetical protein